MNLLDTDHLSVLLRGGSAAQVLSIKLRALSTTPVTIIISQQEILRGHLAQSAKARSNESLVLAYARAQRGFEFLMRWTTLPFDATAAAHVDRLKGAKVRIGTMDLRIAAFALANNATLLSRNLRDFKRIPDLNVEDWTT